MWPVVLFILIEAARYVVSAAPFLLIPMTAAGLINAIVKSQLGRFEPGDRLPGREQIFVWLALLAFATFIAPAAALDLSGASWLFQLVGAPALIFFFILAVAISRDPVFREWYLKLPSMLGGSATVAPPKDEKTNSTSPQERVEPTFAAAPMPYAPVEYPTWGSSAPDVERPAINPNDPSNDARLLSDELRRR
jgi:hypothetical protein